MPRQLWIQPNRMQVFLLFSPGFVEWALAIARALKASNPSCRFIGLACGPGAVYERVIEAGILEAADLQRLDDLEREWLEQPTSPAQRRAVERKFGNDAIQRLVIADASLGRGFISGGRTVETELSRRTRARAMRDRYVFGLLNYVEQTLGNGETSMVFCHRVDNAPSLALGLVSKALDIPFAQIRHTRIGARVIIDTSPFDDLEPVNDSFERILLTNQFPSGTKAAAEAYLSAARNEGSTPDYLDYHRHRVLDQQSLARLSRMAVTGLRAALRARAQPETHTLRCPAPLRHCAFEIAAAIRTRALLRRSPFSEPGDRPAEAFAFFPLHVDPESSTMVQSPMHTDQLSIVEAVAKSLPAGMPLLVKEHIPMLGRRAAGFYDRLTALPGVSLASPFDSGSALVRDAALTTVISSTAGWESMLFGKPTVIMGYPPYGMVNDGFVHCPDISRLPKAIEQALGQEPADERRLLAYVAAAFSQSIECPTAVLWGDVTAQSVAAHPHIPAKIAAALEEIAGRSAAAPGIAGQDLLSAG